MRTPIARSSVRAARRNGEDGAAAVEFGLIIIPLLVLLIGVVQFSVWFWAFQVGAHAAREGARLGAVAPCDTVPISDLVKDRLGSAAYPTSSASSSVTRDDGGDGVVNPGDEITVSVTYDIYDIGFVPVPGSISKAATARIENVPAGGC